METKSAKDGSRLSGDTNQSHLKSGWTSNDWLPRLCQGLSAITVVDNAFATPINQRPLALGADLVVYSATKFLRAFRCYGGLVVGNKNSSASLFNFIEINGASIHPDECLYDCARHEPTEQGYSGRMVPALTILKLALHIKGKRRIFILASIVTGSVIARSPK